MAGNAAGGRKLCGLYLWQFIMLSVSCFTQRPYVRRVAETPLLLDNCKFTSVYAACMQSSAHNNVYAFLSTAATEPALCY